MKFNRILSISISSEGTTEHISLATAKEWLIVEHTDDDSLLTTLIKSVRVMLEKYSKHVMLSSTVSVHFESFNSVFKIPRLPLNEITSFKIYNCTTNAFEDLAATDYRLKGDVIEMHKAGEFMIEYTAGYAEGELPEDLILANKSEICLRYENRGDKKTEQSIASTTETYITPYINFAWQ